MALARYQFTVVDDDGNVVPAASVTVRREASGNPLASLFSDRNGLVPIANPFTADSEGFAAFHVTGGAYWVEAVSGALTRTWRYVGIGLAAESDGSPLGLRYNFDTGVNDADPGVGNFRFNNTTPGSATKVFISETSADGVSLATLLATLDTNSRLIFQSVDGAALLVGDVSGTVVDDGVYRDVPITVVSATAAATFVVGTFGFAIAQGGTDGSMSGPVSSTVGNLASFADTAGDVLQDTGKTITTVGAGKQTIWVPATAMKTRVVGPSAGAFSAGSTEFDYLAFDAATIEDATFNIAMPKSWDESTMSYQIYWTHPATATNFATVWTIFAIGYGNDDAIDGLAYGTLGSVTDTGGTTNDLYISTEGAGGSVGAAAENDLVNFIVRREGTNGADTLAVDAYLIGVKLFFTTNANTDA